MPMEFIPGPNLNTVPPIGFRANRNAVNQLGLTSGVVTQVQFDTEVFDNGGYYDNSIYRWTPPSGLVFLGIQIGVTNGLFAAGALLFGTILKNGNSQIVNGVVAEPLANAAYIVNCAVVDIANGTDYYEVTVFATTTSGTYDVSGAVARTYFSGHLIR